MPDLDFFRMDSLVQALQQAGMRQWAQQLPGQVENEIRNRQHGDLPRWRAALDDLPEIGSVCSGGRYDNLTGVYTKQELPGIGASLGLDRLLAAMEELEMIEKVYAGDVVTPPEGNVFTDIMLEQVFAEQRGMDAEEWRARRKSGIFWTALVIPVDVVVHADVVVPDDFTQQTFVFQGDIDLASLTGGLKVKLGYQGQERFLIALHQQIIARTLHGIGGQFKL